MDEHEFQSKNYVFSSNLVRKLLAVCSCILAYFPIPVLLGHYLIQPRDMGIWLLYLPAIGAFSTWFGRKLPFENIALKSFILGGFGWIVTAALCQFIAKGPATVPFILCGLLTAAVSVLGVRILQLIQAGALLGVWMSGLVIHFLAFFLFVYVHGLHPVTWLIACSTLLTLVFVLYEFNRQHVMATLSSKQTQVPRSVRVFNRLIVTMFLVCVIIAFGCLVFFVNLTAIENTLVSWIQWLLHHFSHPSPKPSQTHMQPFKLPIHPQAKESRGGSGLWMKILTVAVGIVVFASCLFLIWRAVRTFLNWYQKQRFGETEESLGYIDEEESLVGEVNRVRLRSLRRKKNREPAWAELSTKEERVRYLYRQLVYLGQKHGYQFVQSETARETVLEIAKMIERALRQSGRANHLIAENIHINIASLYDVVRYDQKSDEVQSISNDELERWLALIQRDV